MRFFTQRATVTNSTMLLMVLSIGLAGSLSGCGPIPISFTVSLLSDVTMPVLGPIVGNPINNYTVELPKDICSLPTQSTINDKITAHVPAFLLNLVDIEKLTVDRVQLKAAQGSFDDITYTSLDLLVQDVPNPINLGAASAPPAFGTEMNLRATPPPDLLDLLLNTINGKCVGAQVTVSGVVPGEAITFNMTADVTVVIKISLF